MTNILDKHSSEDLVELTTLLGRKYTDLLAIMLQGLMLLDGIDVKDAKAMKSYTRIMMTSFTAGYQVRADEEKEIKS